MMLVLNQKIYDMCEDLEKQAERYMRSVMGNDGDVFTRSDLYEYIIEAYKQGYIDAAIIPDNAI